MKTSNEIKEFIKACINGPNAIELFYEIFNELSETNSQQEMKALNYRWMAACNDVRKENGYVFIDETFFRSIVCYNATLNFKSKNIPENTKQLWKNETGWDAEAITNGIHCKLAKLIIETLEDWRINHATKKL